MIADHPEIANHLRSFVTRRKLTMIPYGADKVEPAQNTILDKLQLKPDDYAVIIARPEPENSILEVVKAFTDNVSGKKLVILGNYDVVKNDYHRAVRDAANDDVIFPGAIYDSEQVAALRTHARFYIHGHQVGGTNPALVEALGAGCAVLANDNKFNRWVAQESAVYFESVEQCGNQLKQLFTDDITITQLRYNADVRFRERFQWESVLQQYEQLLSRFQNAEVKQRSK